MTITSQNFIIAVCENTLDASVREIRDTNRERIPFRTFDNIDSFDYNMKLIFVELVNDAMDTDDVSFMSRLEKTFWAEFVIYESDGTGFDPTKDEQYYALDQVLMELYNYTGELDARIYTTT